jgi:signal transduction histidine kinase
MELGTSRHDALHAMKRRVDVEATGGLGTALSSFMDSVARRSGLRVSLSCAPGPALMDAQVERELLRIAQEAVVNVERHARASSVSVVVDGPVLEVVDDGAGLSPVPAAPGHYGVVGMRERAAAVGGVLEIESARGVGTTVRCRVEA